MERSFKHLVVVGSSAGGIGALSGMIANLPEDFAAPIVVAQHLDPKRESHLQQILSRRSPLRVKTITDHEPLEAGVIFLVPANRHVKITDSEIELKDERSARQPMPSIDRLMESAAEVFGEDLIAVVLSGTGTDGTEGARTVSEAGGTVIIQDPETAEFGEMPRSLAPSTVDIVSSLERIGPILQNLISGITVPEDGPENEERALERFLGKIYQNHGVDFRSYKRPTIMRRLGRRMAATDCGSIEEYSSYLENHPEEYRKLINAFLINVTEFFRDPELFEYLREKVLPEIIEEAREKDNQLRIWSAGCSTGEEAYSLAILVSEVLGHEAGLFNVRIFATDIDEDAVKFARRGIYPPSALKGLSEEQIGLYFTEEHGSYQVKKQIRSMIVFGVHDLAQRSPFPQIDMVVSRNVLIYFSSELQRRALQLFAYSLRDGGYLVLGKAESPAPLAEFFASVDSHNKVYLRQGQRFLMPPTLPAGPVRQPPPERNSGELEVQGSQTEIRPRSTTSGFVSEDVLNRLPVGVVVVNRDYIIAEINDPARRLLSIPGVGVGKDFLHSMQEAPYAVVRRAIDEAFRSRESRRTAEFTIEEPATGEPRHLQLTCYPRRSNSENRRVESLLIVVEDITAAVRTRRLTERNRQLEEANRDLSQLTEELRTAHEESLVNTEEAQAAAEEVETLNEELQATNEELETLNEELQATVEELNTTNDDLQARSQELQEMARRGEEERGRLRKILDSAPTALLVVDGEGRTVFANAAYHRLFSGRDPAFLDPSGGPLAPQHTPRARAARGEAFDEEFSVEVEGAIKRFRIEGQPLDGEDELSSVLVIQDTG